MRKNQPSLALDEFDKNRIEFILRGGGMKPLQRIYSEYVKLRGTLPSNTIGEYLEKLVTEEVIRKQQAFNGNGWMYGENAQ